MEDSKNPRKLLVNVPTGTDVAVPYHLLDLSEPTTNHCSQRQGALIKYSRRIQPG